MLRSTAALLFGQTRRIRVLACQPNTFWFSTSTTTITNPPTQCVPNDDSGNAGKDQIRHYVGRKISNREKNSLLIKTLLDMGDSKEEIYGAMDYWVAWAQDFPISAVKYVLVMLEKQQQWHRVVQVIKWMLSKGQGNTTKTYQQLIKALDMDRRVEEAHDLWTKKIGIDLHSASWEACNLMISVYFRNNMLDRLVRLFKDLEACGRRVPDKLTVEKVADAYELLGLVDDKKRLLVKYNALLNRKINKCDAKLKKPKRFQPRKKRLSRRPSSFAKPVQA